MTVEIIQINNSEIREAAANEERVQIRTAALEAWPDVEVICTFEFNEQSGRWVWELETERFGVQIHRTRCVLGKRYEIWPYAMFQFEDVHGSEERVHENNLGERVVLAVYPGPLGGSFLDEAGISPELEDTILRRHWFDPVG